MIEIHKCVIDVMNANALCVGLEKYIILSWNCFCDQWEGDDTTVWEVPHRYMPLRTCIEFFFQPDGSIKLASDEGTNPSVLCTIDATISSAKLTNDLVPKRRAKVF